MNDMGPRRMDGFGRTAAGPAPRPVGPSPRAAGPAQRPMQRPAGSLPRPVQGGVPGMRPMGPGGGLERPAQPAMRRTPGPSQAVRTPAEMQPAMERPAPKPRKSGGGLGVVIQFIVGLLVIVGVAAAVVILWLKYYQ